MAFSAFSPYISGDYMNPITPSESPEYCWTIALASYEEGMQNTQQFLQDRFPGAKVLEETSSLGWRCILTENQGRLSVAFRGTHKWHNWAINIFRDLSGVSPITTPHFEQKIEVWQKQYGKNIELITAHSGGAAPGSAVFRTSKIARVFFNPHLPSEGETRLNLVTQGDALNLYSLALSKNPEKEMRKLTVLGKGSHSLKDFQPYVEGKTWETLSKTSSRPTFSDSGFDLSQDLENQLNTGNLTPLRDNLKAKKEMLEKALQSKEFLEDFSCAAKEFASTFSSLMDQAMLEAKQDKALRHRLDSLKQTAKDLCGHQYDPFFYGNLLTKLKTTRHPQQGLSLIEDIEKTTQQYSEALQTLTHHLDRQQTLADHLQQQWNRLDQLEEDQRKQLKSLMEKQNSIRRQYRRLQKVCNGIYCVSSVFSHKLAVLAASVNFVGGMVLKPKIHQITMQIEEHGTLLEKNLVTKQGLAHLQRTHQQDHLQSIQSTRVLLSGLRSNSIQFSPSEHRELLQKGIDRIELEIDEQDNKINQCQQRIDDKDNQLLDIKNKIIHLKHKKQKKNEGKLKQLEIDSCGLEKELISLKEQKRIEEEYKDSLLQEQKETNEALHTASINAEYRNYIFSAVQKVERIMSKNTQQARELRREIEQAKNLFNKSTDPLKQDLRMIFGGIQEITGLCSPQGSSLLANSYRLAESIADFSLIGVPTIERLHQTYQGNVWRAIMDNGGEILSLASSCIGMLVPAANLAYIFYRMYQGYQQKSEFSILGEQIHKYVCDLEENIHKMLEKNIEILHQAMQNQTNEIKGFHYLLFDYIDQKTGGLIPQGKQNDARNAHRIFLSEGKRALSDLRLFYSQQNLTAILALQNPQNIQEAVVSCIKDFCQTLHERAFPRFHSDSITIEDLATSGLVLAEPEYATHICAEEMEKMEIFSQFAQNMNTGRAFPNHALWLQWAKGFLDFIHQHAARPEWIAALKNPKTHFLLYSLCQTFLDDLEQLGNLQNSMEEIVFALYEEKNRIHAAMLQPAKNPISPENWSFQGSLEGTRKFSLARELTIEFANRMQSCSEIQDAWAGVLSFQALQNKLNTDPNDLPLEHRELMKSVKTMEKQFLDTYNNQIAILKNEKKNRAFNELRNQIYDERSKALEKLKVQEYWLRFDLKTRTIAWIKDAPDLQWNHCIALANVIVEKSLTEFMKKIKKYFYQDTVKYIGCLGSSRTIRESLNTEQALSIHNVQEGIEHLNLKKTFTSQYTEAIDRKYDHALCLLMSNYATVLSEVSSKKTVSIDALKALQEGQILSCVKKECVPLIFPKELMDSLRAKTNIGLPFSAYQFSYSFENNTLAIRIDISLARQPGPLQFMMIKIAEFDPLTVDSFKPLGISKDPFDASEFLIQAMYGNFAQMPLGLPGNQSFAIHKDAIVSHEVPFEGLFTLFSNSCSESVVYDSRKKISTQTEQPTSAQFDRRPIAILPAQDYLSCLIAAEEEKKRWVEAQSFYIKMFNLLKILGSIYSGMDAQSLLGNLEKHFEIFPPEKIYLLSCRSSVQSQRRSDLRDFLENLPRRQCEINLQTALVSRDLLELHLWLMQTDSHPFPQRSTWQDLGQ